MAIIDSIHGLEVFVEIDGQRVVEYDEPSEDGANGEAEVQVTASATLETGSVQLEAKDRPHIVKYIEAKPGAKFGVRAIRRPEFQHASNFIDWGIEVDGHTSLFANDRHQKHETYERSISSVYSRSENNEYFDHPLRFAALDLTCGKPTEEEMSRGKSCGKIKVVFYHMVKYGEDRENSRRETPMQTQSLPEKALKGKSLSAIVQYDSKPRARPNCFAQVYHDPKKRPFATFEFRYRSREDLMQEGIIPRPSHAERLQSMGEAELRAELLRQLETQDRLVDRQIREKMQSRSGSPSIPRGQKRGASALSDTSSLTATGYKERRLDDGKIEIELEED